MIRRASIVRRGRLVWARVRGARGRLHRTAQSLRPLAERYVALVPQELGAPNVITGILLTYRAFDTLGEVAVLFMVAAGVGLVLEWQGRQRAAAADARAGNAVLARSCRAALKSYFR